jgi:glycerate 2-kinase
MPVHPALSKSSSRTLLHDCLRAALRAVDGRAAVASSLRSLPVPPACPVLALGKAAPAMLAGAFDVLGERIGPSLCITRADAARPGEPGFAGARVLHGDHPVPGERSLAAGRQLLAFVDALPPGAPLLCLLSGGSSALAEALPAGVSAADLGRLNRWLLASGLPIEAVNRVRARMSCLKAGRLAQRLAGRRVMVLAISDVPGDDPATIGSGPWTPPPPGPLPPGLPDGFGPLLDLAPPAPSPAAAGLAEVDFRVVASGALALHAVATAARAAGIPCTVHAAGLDGAVDMAAAGLMAALAAGPPGLHAWSGETTMTLPAAPGAGGRNSHLALALSVALANVPSLEGTVVLCAATDGSDGSGGAAGGWADAAVIARGARLGLDARDALRRADSGTFLAATGDALVTGPTGTNVMDVVLAWRP